MPEPAFDPYYKWLGIPPNEQPPNHYRLLGLQLFEPDADVIANAADRQMTHIRTFQTGKHAVHSQQLLNEFAAAKVCLLRPEKKAEYDRELQSQQAAEPEAAPPHVEPAPPPAAPQRPVAPQRVGGGSSPNLARPRPAQPQPVHGSQPVPVQPSQPVPLRPVQPTPLQSGGFQPVPVQRGPVSNAPGFQPVAERQPGEIQTSHVHHRRAHAKPKSALSNPVVLFGGSVGALVLVILIAMATSSGDPPKQVKATQHNATDTSQVVQQETEPATTPEPAPVETPTKVEPATPATISVASNTPSVTPPPETPESPTTPSTPAQVAVNTPATPVAPVNTPQVRQPVIAPAVTVNPGPTVKKLAVPTGAELAKSKNLIRDLFKTEIAAAKTPEDKARLAQSLLAQADKTSDDMTAHYALCAEALSFGIEGGNWPLVVQIIDTTDKTFEIDALAVKSESLVSLSKVARLPAAKIQIIDVGLLGLDVAVTQERSDLSSKLMAMLQSMAADVKDPERRRKVATAASELRKVQQEWAALGGAAAAVQAKPDDPTANLVYGKLLCMNKGRWDEGLPYLAKCGEAAIVEAAQADMNNPTDVAERLKVGDLWWAIAESEKTSIKAEIERRAGHWYELTVTDLTGLTKIKIEKRLETVKAGPTSPGRPEQSISIDLGQGVSMPMRLVSSGEVRTDSGNVLRIDTAYYIGVTEVSQAQWAAIAGTNPSRNQNPTNPVEQVALDDVAQYLDLLSQRTQRKMRFRLPTALEWEYACRAGSSSSYYHGPDSSRLVEFAWTTDNSGSTTHPVGQLKPNALGLFDTLGNVREMCAEKDQPIYSNRGGAYTTSPSACTCSSTSSTSRTYRSMGLGFRVVCDAGPGRVSAPAVAAATTGTAAPLTPVVNPPVVPVPVAAPVQQGSVSTPAGSGVGMIGSVSVNGNPTGFAITYVPGKCFRQQLVDDELRKLGLIDASAFSRNESIALAGTIRVTKETPTLMWLASGDNFYTVGVTVAIDGVKVADYRDSNRHNATQRITLRRGDHQVVWSLAGGTIGECALHFVDADTKQPLTMFYPKDSVLKKSSARVVIDQLTEVGLPAMPTEMSPGN